MNLELLPGEGTNALSADAEDAAHSHYPLAVEYVGRVPAFEGISMIIVRLDDAMVDLGDVLLRLNLHGMSSNRVRIGVGHVGGGPADDQGAVPTPAPATPPPTPTPTPTPTPKGKIYYVNLLGSDSNPGTRALPFRTIQHAADVVNPGETVIVQDGVYTDKDGDGAIVRLNRGGASGSLVTFRSEHRWGAKLDGLNNSAKQGFKFTGSIGYVRIEGFEIYGMGNNLGSAAGIELYSGGHDSETVGNNIHDVGRLCTSTTKGQDGIFVQQNNVLIEGNIIHDIGRYGPGENGCSNPTFWEHNDHGIYIHTGSGYDIRNNVFYNHVHGWAIHFYPDPVTNTNVFNNTFAFGNPNVGGTHIVIAAALTNVSITNNVFYDTASTGKIIYLSSPGTQTNVLINYNLARSATMFNTTPPAGITQSNNTLSTDPLLVSPTTSDFHLTGSSPAKDTATTISSITKDFDGNTRPQGAGYDIGAYELPH